MTFNDARKAALKGAKGEAIDSNIDTDYTKPRNRRPPRYPGDDSDSTDGENEEEDDIRPYKDSGVNKRKVSVSNSESMAKKKKIPDKNESLIRMQVAQLQKQCHLKKIIEAPPKVNTQNLKVVRKQGLSQCSDQNHNIVVMNRSHPNLQEVAQRTPISDKRGMTLDF